MSAVTVAYVVSDYKKKDGTRPIRIRITYKGKVKYIASNLVARQEQLNKKGEVKDEALRRRAVLLVMQIEDKVRTIPFQSLQSMCVVDVVSFVERVDEDGVFRLDFFSYAERIANEKTGGSRTNYFCAINSLRAFVGDRPFDISELTSSFMRSYEAHLRVKHGENARAVSLYTSAIAYIHGRARLEYNDEETGEVRVKNTFDYYKCPKQKPARHRNLDAGLVQTMIDMRRTLEGRERLAVDAYLLSFALMGMNSPDLYECLPPKRGILTYNRHKTRSRRADEAEMSVRIPKCIKPLYEEYADATGQRAFSFYRRYATYENLTHAIAKGLKQFEERIGYDSHIVFYSCRHTWASHAYSLGIEKSVINDCLCHVDPAMRVTDIYIKKDWNVLWDANARVLESMDWSRL